MPEDGVAADWGIVAEFLRSTSEALWELPEVGGVAYRAGADELGSVPPAVLRYELLAGFLHPVGVARLREAAEAVERCCQRQLGVVPTARELEWIISVAAQEPVVELARRNATSTRGMYRQLEAMWGRLGVRNQVQGVALAVQEGWIGPPPAGWRSP
ncbi:hypothetical protein [Candidatus Poriferisocius sp.]|uniref:hypothetical protein n=1 Tax=Candidatus Poriferisocius sp. TaxID=3101276 RepID=UPI003B027F12